MARVPAAEVEGRADSLEIVRDPIDRARAGLREHQIVKENRVEQAVTQPQDDGEPVATSRIGKRQVDVILGIFRRRAGERRAVRCEDASVGLGEDSADIAPRAIHHRRRRRDTSDGDRPAALIGNHELVRRVRRLEQLHLIDVVRLQRLVPNLQPEPPGAVRLRAQAIDVASLEQR